MDNHGIHPSRYGLADQGLDAAKCAYWNLPPAVLVEMALARGEAELSSSGSLAARTGKYTGRCPADKFLVETDSTRGSIDWGKVNRPIAAERFDRLLADMNAYLSGRDVFVQDCWAGADPKYRMPIRVITELAWHSLFAQALLVRPERGSTAEHRPQFTVLNLANFKADPQRHGTRSEVFIIVHFDRRMVIIGGTQYAGEIKKSVFTILNHLLPESGVLPMHCSANTGDQGDTALFFGLSGTGKTTLSADPQRRLIGDDEHGWTDTGVFNFEGGCYAKCINLSQESEPQIYGALRFGSVLENVVLDPQTRDPDFNDASLTENTRAAYPLHYIDNTITPSLGGHPSNVVFLTCDAFGVLPPIARLSGDQAMYHFLSGYTAKVAGTEAGVTEPQATFSTLFGAPFFTRPPVVYARLLGQRLEEHQARCWLVNTGWSGGPYGVGRRMKLSFTRAMIHAALSGQLDSVQFEEEPVFGLRVPASCPGVPGDVLLPRNTWQNKSAYDDKAAQLAQLFRDNFQKLGGIPADIQAAGPRG